jgi:sarcosine oxidase gamma subunit
VEIQYSLNVVVRHYFSIGYSKFVRFGTMRVLVLRYNNDVFEIEVETFHQHHEALLRHRGKEPPIGSKFTPGNPIAKPNAL